MKREDRINLNVTIGVMTIGIVLLINLFIVLAHGSLDDSTPVTPTIEPTNICVELDDKVVGETENEPQSENKGNIKKGHLM